MIRRGCALISIVLGALFAAYLWLLWELEFPVNLILAAFGALGVLMLGSALKQMLFGSDDLDALKRALEGAPLQEGSVEAVWGPITPLGEPLEAPFSGRPCVAYEYDAIKPSEPDDDGGTRGQGSYMSGLALTPCVIRSNRGPVRLLGFSMLTHFPARSGDDSEISLERARNYLESTDFEQVGLLKISALLSQIDSMVADDDGTVRKDWLMEKREAIDLAQGSLSEKFIAPGATITAVGIWDPARGGLVPKYGNKTQIVSLRPGGGEAAVATALKRPWALLAFALIWCGFVHGFIYVALTRGI